MKKPKRKPNPWRPSWRPSRTDQDFLKRLNAEYARRCVIEYVTLDKDGERIRQWLRACRDVVFSRPGHAPQEQMDPTEQVRDSTDEMVIFIADPETLPCTLELSDNVSPEEADQRIEEVFRRLRSARSIRLMYSKRLPNKPERNSLPLAWVMVNPTLQRELLSADPVLRDLIEADLPDDLPEQPN